MLQGVMMLFFEPSKSFRKKEFYTWDGIWENNNDIEAWILGMHAKADNSELLAEASWGKNLLLSEFFI
jgi:hypothetical protein